MIRFKSKNSDLFFFHKDHDFYQPCLWVVVDLKRHYRNSVNEWMNDCQNGWRWMNSGTRFGRSNFPKTGWNLKERKVLTPPDIDLLRFQSPSQLQLEELLRTGSVCFQSLQWKEVAVILMEYLYSSTTWPFRDSPNKRQCNR